MLQGDRESHNWGTQSSGHKVVENRYHSVRIRLGLYPGASALAFFAFAFAFAFASSRMFYPVWTAAGAVMQSFGRASGRVSPPFCGSVFDDPHLNE